MLYPHNVLEGFGNGCLMDYRVRVALNLLATSPIFHGAAVACSTPDAWGKLPHDLTACALEMADELMRQGEAYGMVEPLPTDDELASPLKKQAKRTGSYSAHQQIKGQEYAQRGEANNGITLANDPGIPFARKQ